jgi:uncharacterized protein YdeI (YjbR/CyaY-like superfamily)
VCRLDRRRGQRIDAESYRIRFTPRRARSSWSAVNIGRMAELTEAGLVTAGRRAFEAQERSGISSYEQRDSAGLDPAAEEELRVNTAAGEFFSARPPAYRQGASWWVLSAERAETREKRLATLIADRAAGRRVAQLSRPPRAG